MASDTIAPTQATPSSPSFVDAQVPSLDSLARATQLVRGELIGRGGMGEVHLARDARLGRQLALKTSTTMQADAIQRFVREARVQGQLEHPGIVPVHELGIDEEGRPFFTMKRVRGTTFAEAMRDGSVPRRRLLTVLQTLGLTLDFVHSRGVIHRDVKPANVMLGDFGEVYLLDWGLAKVGAHEDEVLHAVKGESQPGMTIAGAVLGTPGYMSPEQARGEPASSASDVWAVGVMLYEVLTGARLLEGREAMAVLMATNQLENPSPRAKNDQVSPELDALCRATLSHEATDRPTAREFSERLEAILAGERDTELRSNLADQHAANAEAAAERAIKDHSLDARREALREVGQALALEPGLSRAHDVFARLLAAAPDELPPEVNDDLEKFQTDNERLGIRNGFTANVFTGLLLTPAVLWVKNWPLFLLMMSLWATSILVSAWLVRLTVLTRFSRTLGLTTATAVNACLALISGPLMIVPAVATAYAMSVSLWLPKKERTLGVVMQLASVFVPLLLSVFGFLPRFYEPMNDGMFIHPVMVELSPKYWVIAMSCSVTGILLASVQSMARVRKDLKNARASLALQRWNLEQLRSAAPRSPVLKAAVMPMFDVPSTRPHVAPAEAPGTLPPLT
ncbi:MAG: serine/threonine-protein kinase [Archangium sp.]